MNKIFKKIGIAALTASMLASAVAFAACDDADINININTGHKHSLTEVAAVAAGCETDGNKQYYKCECGKWFEDEAANTEITDHSTVEIKATGHNWDGGHISDDNTQKIYTCLNCNETKSEKYTSSATLYSITYNYNYDGAPAASVIKYESGQTVSEPAAPVNPDKGYVFGGWYLESECATKYDFSKAIDGDVVLYAQWKEKPQSKELYVFEAEYTKIKTLNGVGWSNSAKGLDMIMRDTDGAVGVPGVSQASNGFYVGYLYKNGITLTFEITSDVAVEDATLSLRLSGEMVDSIILTGDEYLVKVNGEQINYDGFSITGIDPAPDAVKRGFEDYLVTASLKLAEGKNTITLTTNNGKKLGGTATATAPLVDCIKIETSATLTWSPITKNLADWG